MSNPEADPFERELNELLAIEAIEADVYQFQPLDELNDFLNKAVSQHLLTFTEDTFNTHEEVDETLVAIAKCVEDELSCTSLLDEGDLVRVRGRGALLLIGTMADEIEGSVPVADEIEVYEASYIEGFYAGIIVDEAKALVESRQETDEQPSSMPLRIVAVDIFIALRDAVKHEVGCEDEQFGDEIAAVIDINNATLKPERIINRYQNS